MDKSFSLIDKPTVLGSLFLLLSVVIPLILFPTQGADWIASDKY
ncbi:BCCT family transporter, partial [Vibrio diabolicus]